MYSCLGTKAVGIWAAPGYSTDDFHLAHTKQTSVYGCPKVMVSDQGTQIKRGAQDFIDWDKVQHQTASAGTCWKFTPPGSPWRNGNSERAIQMAKKTLSNLLSNDASLNFAELETLFIRVAHVLNTRPLSGRITADNYWLPISPNDLLHGRASGLEERLTFHFEKELEAPLINKRLEQIRKLEEAWWSRWSEDGFQLLCPRKKWHVDMRGSLGMNWR